MKLYKPKFWNSKNFLSLLLLPISIIVIFITLIKKRFIKPLKFKVPIICVGNIYVGGTGKTPLSIFLASELKNYKKTAIIKKYYKQHQDEHLLIKDKFKNLFLCKKRASGINEAIDKGNEILILDDGFQDYQIKKNLNIVCFNQLQRIGNGLVIPSGPLRESMNAIKNAQIVVINGEFEENFESKLLKINQNLSIFYTNYVPLDVKKFENKKFFAVAGIGNPENFFKLLSDNDLKISKKIVFPDHYEFKKSEILDKIKEAKNNNCEIIMTEKDFFKVKDYNLKEIKYLKIDLIFKNKETFIKKVIEHLDEDH